MASTEGPEAEFNNSRRKELLKVLKGALLADTIPPTTWACLWLSDIDSLEYIVDLTQKTPIFANLALEAVEPLRIVPTWTQRRRLSSAPSTSQKPPTSQKSSASQKPSTPRLQSPPAQGSRGRKRTRSGQVVIRSSRTQADQCRQRDQGKCIITKADEITEVAHIYPFSMRNEDSTTRERTAFFWHALRMFWSKERIDAWHNAIISTSATTEVCQNLLCLQPSAHAYWEKARFALKPIRVSDDKKRLDVQFFWLSRNPHVQEVDILQSPSLLTPDIGPQSSRLFNHETDTIIKSGDQISLETDDQVLRPLPDFRLLEMQWFLHRVTAMSGAAEPQDNSYDDDSDIDIMQAWHDRLDVFTEDDWNIEVEEMPTTKHVEEGCSLAQPSGVNTFRHLSRLRGGGGDDERDEEEDDQGEGQAGEDQAGEGRVGETRE